MISGHLINVTFSLDDVENYLYVYKHVEPELQGKMKWKKAKRNLSIPIEIDLIAKIKERPLQLYGDLFFTGSRKHPFLLSIAKPIDLLQVTDLNSRSANELIKAMIAHCFTFLNRQWRLRNFYFDRERAADCSITENQLLAYGVTLDLSDAGTHVPPIERPIQTVKNCIRATKASVPYEIKEPRIRKKCVICCKQNQ